MFSSSERLINKMCCAELGQHFAITGPNENINSLLSSYFSNLPKKPNKVVTISIIDFDITSKICIDFGEPTPTIMNLKSRTLTTEFLDRLLNCGLCLDQNDDDF